LLVTAGCYAPVIQTGAPCDSEHPCPSELTCTPTPTGDRCEVGPVGGDIDAPVTGDSTSSTGPDAPLSCTGATLLTGGTDVAAQGWDIVTAGAGALITYQSTVTRMQTSGNSSQLIVRRGVLPLADMFTLDITIRVITSGGHSDLAAAAALMLSFHDPSGNAEDRAAMAFLDNNRIGWGDGTVEVSLNTQQMVTYQLSRRANELRAVVDTGSVSAEMSRTFQTNGTLAIGDQTVDNGRDSTLEVTSVVLRCP
jgi:hypothetical protein